MLILNPLHVVFQCIFRQVSIYVKGKSNRLYLGTYYDEVEAAHAYDAMARKMHGEDAKTNFASDGVTELNNFGRRVKIKKQRCEA